MEETARKTNALVVLGPTATGKTSLGVQLARALGGEILSADSRQVYRGLDIGSGKDLSEYTAGGSAVPFHLIDIAGLDQEFSVYDFHKAFHAALAEVRGRGRLPVTVGGTGLYLEAVIQGYDFADAPENPELREELAALDDEALRTRLLALRPGQHNTTDLGDRERLLRAIEIAEAANARDGGDGAAPSPGFHPLILGVSPDRDELRRRIARRLHERLSSGLVEEVAELHAKGHSWERLERLGLEYRHAALFLQGRILNKNDLFQKLNAAIVQFARRQETWFRRMERRGVVIHWMPRADIAHAMRVIAEHA
ncbi:MAG: tRNA (adenosine(37)-N6)-dimethylallyltransferase MiaA [Candidatus Hydrogenedens sp.]|nr:tRNA (adenosine(37)-N6)-dimethylallyltransferase MiaA [Candidatus Hydrogenedentota bacterium]NLF56584.1 tRNA (adenosine(37)-N6)-dimethylallyltransferase MiaA [Candidatus Hydrogenedens sp.]